MGSLTDFGLNEEYKRIEQLGDKLAQLEAMIDWEAFRPIVAGLYDNRSEKGGRPNIDEVVMIKLLVLQAWYGLSDPELERQVADRISFRRFLGSWDVIPDHSTVWLFRERLMETGKDKEVWDELQRQLDAKGYDVKMGVIQDASVIIADPGQKNRKKKGGGEGRVDEHDEAPVGHRHSHLSLAVMEKGLAPCLLPLEQGQGLGCPGGLHGFALLQDGIPEAVVYHPPAVIVAQEHRGWMDIPPK